jgi:type IV fimbrial biogenesis protein FimT
MNTNSGVSLAEVMLVMALTAIVAGFAVPSYQIIIGKTQMKLARQQLVQALGVAREAALTHHSNVVLCGSQSGLSCDGNWSEGQVILIESSKEELAHFPALPRGVSVSWRANLGHNETVEFNPSGVTFGQWGSFWLKDSRGTTHRIIINALGRVTEGIN